MAKNCRNERMAIAFQWVAVGSILIVAMDEWRGAGRYV
jgi:hypothetical protein